ncbi:alpha/beta fold hydrolase [Brucella cytisi]|uniref:alpha/beta fold hydrolase n=1 Tax=Brucella cytisi TaxID=407152 RepID=UPI0035DE8448
MSRITTALILSVVLATSSSAFSDGSERQKPIKDPTAHQLQSTFDPVGAEVHTLQDNGRELFFIDEGKRDDRAVVFIGGQATSLEAFQLTEFARTTREQFGIRIISVERNGFGESSFDPKLGYQDYTREILTVLDHLDIDRFAIVAISGGGAYAAHLAATVPDRVLSLHAAAAVSRTLPTRSEPKCNTDEKTARESLIADTHNPKKWWAIGDSPVQAIPGWQTRAYADATRSFYVGGQLGDPAALAHENMLVCGKDAIVDSKRITAPTYLYYGDADTAVPVDQMRQWQAALPNVVKAKVYAGEGHTVQYRHWDQILADLAGYSEYTIVCRDGNGKLVANDEVGVTEQLGICAWKPNSD